MKKAGIQLIAIGLALISSIFYTSCKKEEAEDQEIAFSIGIFESSGGSNLKSAHANDLNNVRRIILSIKQIDGTSTRYSSTRMEIYKLNGEFLSPKIILKRGFYYLTEFLLLDSLDNTIFVIPNSGSAEQNKVNTPLPVLFSVDDASSCRVEVTSTEGKKPSDFGLVSFTVSENTYLDFQIAVTEMVSGEYIPARLNVASENYSYSQELEASSANIVTIVDRYRFYEITLEKEGYKTYKHTFSIDSLMLFNGMGNNIPLFVELEKENVLNLKDSVIDIEGNVYKTIKIGNQSWMAENLRATKFNDGTSIPNVPENEEWMGLKTPAYCWYNNDVNTFKNNYGALYNLYTIQDKNVCPTGWHVPNQDEWKVLVEVLGGEELAGAKLRELTIALLPSGFRDSDGYFLGIDDNYSWWAPSSSDPNSPLSYFMYASDNYLHSGGGSENNGLSIRCIKD